jgi:CO/xanthine dehydrogenase Mo-binding subunit
VSQDSDLYPPGLLEKFQDFVYVGHEVTRIDALDKVLGSAKYFGDYFSRELLAARVFTSIMPHALIRGINLDELRNLPDIICVLTSKDIPGANNSSYLITDQPLLAEGKARYQGEPIGIIVGKSEDAVVSALEKVKVDYVPLPAVLDPQESLKNVVKVHEEGNIVFANKIIKGDAIGAMKKSKVVIEGDYTTQWQDHAYVEPEGAVAYPTETGVRIVGVQQHPHLAQMVVARVLGINEKDVEIITPVIGGAFGGKDDVGPWVCAQAALAAKKAGKPVILTYNREESFLIHPKRFPFHIHYETGADEEGKLQAVHVKVLVDTGAYSNRGPFVLFRGMLTSSGPYEVPNVLVEGSLVYTNKVLGGSFRGFGNPEVHFAAEAQMDKLAAKLGIDPVEIRRRNLLMPGSLTSFGQRLEEDVGLKEALELVAAKSNFLEKRKEYDAYNSKSPNRKKGIGLACVFYGTTITAYRVDGSPRPDWSSIRISVDKAGKVRIDTGIVEMGQGTFTGIAQVAAEVLGLSSLDVISIVSSSSAPDTWATHSSRGMSYGSTSVYPAAVKLREMMGAMVAKELGTDPKNLSFRKGYISAGGATSKRMTFESAASLCHAGGLDLEVTETVWHKARGGFDPSTLTGYIYPSISYCAFVSEVEVDKEVGSVKVTKAWPSVSAGRIINRAGARQQIVGAFVQGLGLSLIEEVKFKFVDYLVPRSGESPDVQEPIFVEIPHRYGTMGAKGLGEMGLVAAPPSISNAIAHALGMRVTELPMTPERICAMLKEAR